MERIRVEVERELGAMGDGGAGAGVMPRVVEVWSDVVGSTVARNAWPARISRDGTLHVATDSAAWAFELQHLEREIAGRLAATVGDGAPLQLKFAVGQPGVGGADDASPVSGAARARRCAHCFDRRRRVARARCDGGCAEPRASGFRPAVLIHFR
jgi:hypothetical protein